MKENLTILIRGAGDVASGIAHRLFRCHFKICLTEVKIPQAVRRAVAFSEAVYDGQKSVEGVIARLVLSPEEITAVWGAGQIPVLVDPEATIKNYLKPDVLVDAILAKQNLGTSVIDAPFVVGVGPGFFAGRDVHVTIETNRGHNLGRLIYHGEAEPDTGIPATICGIGAERVLRASRTGLMSTDRAIGDMVNSGEVILHVDGSPVRALIHGVIRGLLRNGTHVHTGRKIGDIDPRGIKDYCFTISDKAMAIAGGVLEAILAQFNR